MKKILLILIAVLLLPSAYAQLSCSIGAAGACTGTVVFKLSDSTDAHASLNTVPDTSAPWNVCCTGVPDLTVGSVPILNQFVVGLAMSADSHVSIVRSDYSNEVYIDSNSMTINCGEELSPAECGAYQTCLYEVPGGSADDHVFPCSSPGVATRRQVCCSAIGAAGCFDTDGGQDYAVQGTTTVGADAKTDNCAGNILTEYWCVGDVRNSEQYDCAATGGTCVAGACVPAGGCVDSDNGRTYWLGGSVNVPPTSYLDSCLDADTLREEFCEAGARQFVDYTCPADSVCDTTSSGLGICTCVDADGNNLNVQGSTFDAVGNYVDSCVGDQVREFTCDPATNRIVATNTDCGSGMVCSNGACGTAFPCRFVETFWTDGFAHGLTNAAVGLPVYAIIIASNDCNLFSADFVMTNQDTGFVYPLIHESYQQEGGTWYAIAEFIPDAPGTYTYEVTTINEPLSEVRSDGELEVTGPCTIVGALEPCPGNWVGPEDQDADCDGVQDCLDSCIGNFGGVIDPNNGCSPGAPSCELDAWDCSATTFTECAPDPLDTQNYIQTREGLCAVNPVYVGYCPPPINERGCVIEGDFPFFDLMNLLAVSLMLVGFYAFKTSKFR